MTETSEYPEATAPAQPSGLSGVIPMTAIVLAVLTAVLNLCGARAVVFGMLSEPKDFDNALGLFTIAGSAVAIVALCWGAYLMGQRDETGRNIVVVTSGVLAACAIVALAGSLLDYRPDLSIQWPGQDGPVFDAVSGAYGLYGSVTALVHVAWLPSLIGIVAPLATFLTAASGSSVRWVAAPPVRPYY